jgi:protein-disulfide isomerase
MKRTLRSVLREIRPVGWLVACMLLVPAGGSVSAGTAALSIGQQSEFEKWFDSQPRVTVPVSAEGASVVIVKFTDYQCPACASTYSDYRPILEKYRAQFPGAVSFIVKDFPLDRDCNPGLVQTMHPAACEAAAAVALAGRSMRAAEMEQWLYTNQATLTPASIRQAAKTIGQVPDFDAGYPQVVEGVKADAALGRLLGVTGTPTLFINGTKLVEPLQGVYFDAAIAYELRKAGKIKR